MPYDRTKDPYVIKGVEARTLYADKQLLVTPNNSTDFASYCYIMVTNPGATGTLKYLPAKNEDGEWVTVVGVSALDVPPALVRRLHTDTDATVYTAELKE